MSRSQQRPAARFHQTVPSGLEDVEKVCVGIRRFMLRSGVADLCFAIELLARECLNNAVVHANNSKADKSVDVTVSIAERWVRLEVQDEGSGFAWQKAYKKELDTIECSGRGLQICALYADRVRFNRRGNRIVLWVKKRKEMERKFEHGRICIETRR